MKHSLLFLSVFFSSFLSYAQLDVGADGWTKLNTQNCSKIVYVSDSDGNDQTGEIYSTPFSALGNDPFLPDEATIKPYKTIEAAANAVGNGDNWILVKRGDTFQGGLVPLQGPSPGRPFVYASYGSSNEVPFFLSGDAYPIRINRGPFENFAVIGLSFYAEKRDPNNPNFDPNSIETRGVNIYVGGSDYAKNILIEGCVFNFYANNSINSENGTVSLFKFRRNLVINNYSSHKHAQGFYTAYTDSIVFEENIFDHNGWIIQGAGNAKEDGQATIFNHDTYFTDAHNATFVGNSFYRPSSIGTKWTADKGEGSASGIYLENNFYHDCELAISLGGNNTNEAYRFKDIVVKDNVMNSVGLSQPSGRTLGWGIEIHDWDNGVCDNNYIINQKNDAILNTVGLYIRGENRDVTISNNTIYGLKKSNYVEFENIEFINSTFSNNHFTTNESDAVRNIIYFNSTWSEGLTMNNNRYDGIDHVETPFDVTNTDLTFDEWVQFAGESNLDTTNINYVDPTRSLERYIVEVLGLSNLDEFYTQLHHQTILNWREAYTATAINNWIKAGFEIQSTTIPVTGFSLDPSQANIVARVGETITLNTSITPIDATNQNITWASSNESVATVSTQGIVTLVSEGNATITATTEEGNFTVESSFTVLTESPEVWHQDHIFKTVNGEDKLLRAFYPGDWTSTDARPVAVLFHGGSWIHPASYIQMFDYAEYLAEQGIVAISAEYTTGSVQSCVLDARSAMRWVKSHAALLGIDDTKVMAGGQTAGALLAFDTYSADGLDDPQDDLSISPQPNLLFLASPILSIKNDQYNIISSNYGLDVANKVYPVNDESLTTAIPTILFSGTADHRAEESHQLFQKVYGLGADTEFWLAEGEIMNFDNNAVNRERILYRLHQFLFKHGYVNALPTVDDSSPLLFQHNIAGHDENLITPVAIVNTVAEQNGNEAINLINETSLTDLNLPLSIDDATMWQSGTGTLLEEFIFDLGEEKAIDAAHIWNWNSSNPSHKIGLKRVEISVATGDDYTTAQFEIVDTVKVYRGGQYAQNFSFDEQNTRFVKFNIIEIENTAYNRLGFAEVRFSGEPQIPVSGISFDINEELITSYVGEQLLLTALVTPLEANNKEVIWLTSDTTIAVVNQQGEVNLVAEGDVTITATTIDGAFTSQSNITIRPVTPTSWSHDYVYKTVESTGKKMRVFYPENWTTTDNRPVAVLFHGGSWIHPASYIQMFDYAEYLAEQGIVAISAEYTTGSVQSCVLDARSAMRWVKSHAALLGIDDTKVMAGGQTAGALLAFDTYSADGLDDPQDDISISPQPNLLFLASPILSIKNDQYNIISSNYGVDVANRVYPVNDESLTTAIPTILFSGTADHRAEESHQLFQKVYGLGADTEFWLAEGEIMNFDNNSVNRERILYRLHQFLFKHGYVNALPTVDDSYPLLFQHNIAGFDENLITPVAIVNTVAEQNGNEAINLINETSLTDLNLPLSIDDATMWQSGMGTLLEEFVFDLGEEQAIDAVHIWNWNSSNPSHKIGLKRVEISVATGEDYTTAQFEIVDTVKVYRGGQYAQNFSFDEQNARFVKFNIIEIENTAYNRLGFAEVRFSGEPDIEVTDLSFDISQSFRTGFIGQEVSLSPTFTPSNASNKAVTWSTNNAAVATVDTEGLVTLLTEGTVQITATSEDGSFTAQSTIDVHPVQNDVWHKEFIYQTVDGEDQVLRVHYPADWQQTDNRPVAVLFHGGSWIHNGSYVQMFDYAEYLAQQGIVAISASYKEGTVESCILSSRSAMRWVKGRAAWFGIDANRVIAGGTTAGALLAFDTYSADGLDNPQDDLSISSQPNLLFLASPILSIKNDQYNIISSNYGVEVANRVYPVNDEELTTAIPTILFSGSEDYRAEETHQLFQKVYGLGADSEFWLAEGQTINFDNSTINRERILYRLHQFLFKNGYVNALPTEDLSSPQLFQHNIAGHEDNVITPVAIANTVVEQDGNEALNVISASTITDLNIPHSIDDATMWQSGFGTLTEEFVFDLGTQQAIDAIHIWNWNSSSPSHKIGLRRVEISVATGIDYATASFEIVDTVKVYRGGQFAQNFSFDEKQARFVKFNIIEIENTAYNRLGFAEIKFSGASSTTPIAVSGVSFETHQTTISAQVGESLSLIPVISPAQATNKNVIWLSNNTQIATVDLQGLVTLHAAGTVTIQATTVDGGFTAESQITVSPVNNDIAVTSISFDVHQEIVTSFVGEQLTLVPFVTPQNATNTGLTWSTNNPSVATVSSQGIVSLLTEGNVIITVTTNDGSFTAQSAITVITPSQDVTHQEFVYKTVNGIDKKVRVYYPGNWNAADNRPVAVMFHGGSWVSGTYFQMFPWASYLASQGIVAISAEYTFGTVESCVLDARSAMRWVKAHAGELGIDTTQVIAGGASAGAHIAYSTYMSDGLDDPTDDLSISPKPQLMFLIDPALVIKTSERSAIEAIYGTDVANKTNPVTDNSLDGNTPPTALFSGTNDYRAEESHQLAQKLYGLGVDLEFWLGEGGAHGFGDDAENIERILYRLHQFLNKHGYITSTPVQNLATPDLFLHDFGGDKTGLISPVAILNDVSTLSGMSATSLIDQTQLNSPSDAHSTSSSEMWQTSSGTTVEEFVFDMGQLTTVDAVHIWNWNNASPSYKIGVRNVEISVSTDSDASTAQYTVVDTFKVYRGGAYAQNYSFGTQQARLIKFNILEPEIDAFQHLGLAEVKFSSSGSSSKKGVIANTITSDVKLFPNPGNGFINFSSSINGQVEVYQMGQLIESISLENENQMNISHLSSGSYILKWFDETTQNYIQKLYIKVD